MSDPRSIVRNLVSREPERESVRIDEMLDECGCGCGGPAGSCVAVAEPSAAEVEGEPTQGYGGKAQDLGEKLQAYESGDLSQGEIVAMFQELVDSGVIHHLQGSYGRAAMALAQSGLIKVPQETAESLGAAQIPEPAGSNSPGHEGSAYKDPGSNTDPEYDEDPADIPDAEGSDAAGHGKAYTDPSSVKPAKDGY